MKLLMACRMSTNRGCGWASGEDVHRRQGRAVQESRSHMLMEKHSITDTSMIIAFARILLGILDTPQTVPFYSRYFNRMFVYALSYLILTLRILSFRFSIVAEFHL